MENLGLKSMMKGRKGGREGRREGGRGRRKSLLSQGRIGSRGEGCWPGARWMSLQI